MKKILIILILVMISIISFAEKEIMEINKEIIPRHLHKMKKISHHRSDPEAIEARAVIEKKRLEVRRELLTENPNWEKIEKLNIEIATEEAKLRTKRMKVNFEKECKQ